MKFCTVINCMDGRVQLPVIKYLQVRFDAEAVDSITEAGPNLILSQNDNSTSLQSVFERLKISVEKHKSVGIAIAGHFDCAGNPSSEKEQIVDIQNSVQTIRKQYENIEIIGLWVDANWDVHELDL